VKRAVEYLEKNGITRERVILVASRFGQPNELLSSEAEESLGMKISYYLADDPRTVNDANNKGIPLVVGAPRSKVSSSIALLAKGLGIVDHLRTATEANHKDLALVIDAPRSKFSSGFAFLARGLGLAGNAG
jgi:Flp pilus assembly CpaE family ATPase